MTKTQTTQQNIHNPQINRSNIALYTMDACPYCVKVFDAMRANDISLPVVNLSNDPSYIQRLVNVGGKRQVPCLIVNGKALYESTAIIKWLEQNKDILASE